MVQDYVVTLTNKNRRYINIINLLICSISLVFFIRGIINQYQFMRVLIAATVLLVVFGVFAYRKYKQNPAQPVYLKIGLLVSGFGWAAMPFMWWLCFPIFALAIMEKIAKHHLEIGFTEQGITINTVFATRHKWSEFNNIVLKDNLLTLDYKNNKLLQRETIDEEGDAEEDEFNDYCRLMLTKANQYIAVS